MFVAGLSPWIALLAGLVPGVVVAVLVARGYQRKLHDLAGRMDTLHRAREQTNELLLTARRQADMLSKELEHVRRHLLQRGGGVLPHPVLPVATSGAAAGAGTDGFGDTEVGVKDHQGFADTLAAPRR
jgi:hypothetical protein